MSPLVLLLIATVLFGLWMGFTPARPLSAAPAVQFGTPAAVARFDNVNIHSGPDTNYPVIGVIP